ncbi:MAG: hypothetical protein A2Y89_05355 [Chloroflexi bacterium RBG_13_51_18]|nr:MAG: hypothetical protein A2Y89_05355 [Chloroflexi bacterium RBG_13_51_18]
MSLLEVLVCIAILGGVLITMVFGMSGGALTVRENDQEAAVQNLARNQMEYIKNLAYVPGATTYPAISTPPEYSITVVVTTVPDTNTDIQKVTANITRSGVPLMTISDYKVNR